MMKKIPCVFISEPRVRCFTGYRGSVLWCVISSENRGFAVSRSASSEADFTRFRRGEYALNTGSLKEMTIAEVLAHVKDWPTAGAIKAAIDELIRETAA